MTPGSLRVVLDVSCETRINQSHFSRHGQYSVNLERMTPGAPRTRINHQSSFFSWQAQNLVKSEDDS